MSRKSKHRQLNPTPPITLFGDPLDRLLNGGFTDELRKKLPKDGEVAAKALPRLVATENPLRIVFYRNTCNCGSISKAFGYFCRKVTEKTNSGHITSYKPVEPNGPPQEIVYQDQKVPYCISCIPSGLNLVGE